MDKHIDALLELRLGCRFDSEWSQQAAEQVAALDAAIALMRGQSWQPIETAPRTGIAVLLWQPWKSGRNCRVIGHYANGWVCQHFDDMQPEPTHWQPLPSPPKDTADEQ